MKHRILHILLSSLTFLPISALAQSEPVVEGMSYYLPKTALKFTLLIEKTTFTPGELCDYANRYLMQTETVLAPSTTYSIINMKMEAVGLPDKEKHFTATATQKNSIEKLFSNEDGVLISVNKEPVLPKKDAPFVAAAKPEPLNPRDFLTQEILSVGSKSKLAQLCAKEIYDIREARNELSRGQAEITPKDGEQLRLMMETMDKQERALTSLFNGTTVKDTLEEVVVFCDPGEVQKRVVFRFSEFYGLCAANDLAGEPYYITITDRHQTPEDLRTEKEKMKQRDLTGLFVNVPGRARVTVYQQENKWAEQDISYAQFGRVENVSPALFSTKVHTTYDINPYSGAMRNLNTESIIKK